MPDDIHKKRHSNIFSFVYSKYYFVTKKYHLINYFKYFVKK